MNSLDSIVVGIDFSNCSLAALAQAARMARWNHATLHVFHVIDSVVAGEIASATSASLSEVKAELIQDAEQAMKDALSGVEQIDSVKIEAVVDHPLDGILKKVKSVPTDLLVLGAYGKSGEDSGAGRFAYKCVRKAQTKVLLVNERERGPYARILACVDFSETSRRAVEQACHVALQDGSELHLLHIHRPPWTLLRRGGYRIRSITESEKYKREYLAALESRFAAWSKQFDEDTGSLTIHRKLLEGEDYSRGIINYGLEIRAELVVMGTLGSGGLRYLMLGSTAENVLRHLSCSLLAIKPPKS